MAATENRSDLWKWVVGWVIGFLLATIPQMLVYSSRFAVVETKTNRNTTDIKNLQDKGSDPVQSMAADMKWLRDEIRGLREDLRSHIGSGKPLSLAQ
jgi:hypothetical protein